MKWTMKKVTACFGVLAFAMLVPLAHANVVSHGGFEPVSDDAGDAAKAAWPPTGNASIEKDSTKLGGNPDGYQVRSGTYSLGFIPLGDSDLSGSVRQGVTLNDGLTYKLDFYLHGVFGETGGSPFSGFVVSLGGTNLLAGLSHENDDNPEWTHFFLKDIKGTGFKFLTFSFNDGGINYVDDVSLICTSENCNLGPPPANVPEPGTLLLLGAALAAVGVTARRRKQA